MATAELRTRSRSGVAVAAVAALTLLAALLRLPTLSLQSFWLDEAVTAELVRRSLGGMLAALPASESTPPLYYLLAWPWARVFGSGEAGLRSLSAIAGIATVPVMYAAAARLVSRRAGIVAAALTATSPLLIWFSQEARAYALLTLLSALTLLFMARRGYAAWAVAAALALATHYFAVFVVAPELAWLLARRRTRAGLWAAAAVAAAGAALLPLAISQASGDRAAFIRHSPLLRRIVQVPKQDLLGYGFPQQLVPVLLALLLGAGGLALLALRPQRGAGTALALATAALAAPLALALFGLDYVVTRNLLAAWPLLAVALAAGLGAAGRAGVAAAAALCALGIYAHVQVETHPAYQRDDWRGLARALGPSPVARAIVIEPLNGFTALREYRPRIERLPATPVAVAELDLVTVGRRHPPTPAPPPGFALAERRAGATYLLIRLRSSQPRPVVPAWIAPLRLSADPADFAYEPPGT